MKENLRNNNYTNDDVKINFAIPNIYDAIRRRINELYEQNSSIVDDIGLNLEIPREKRIDLLECARWIDFNYYKHIRFLEYYDDWVCDPNCNWYESNKIVSFFEELFDLPVVVDFEMNRFCNIVDGFFGYSPIINDFFKRIEETKNFMIRRIDTELSILRDTLKETNEDFLQLNLGITEEEDFQKIKTAIGI